MSMYQQQSVYAQPQYRAVPTYPPPPPPSYPQQYYHHPAPSQPPHQPLYHVDPAVFRRDLMSRLSNLTFNSKVHIQDISVFAQEYPQWADIVAQCVDQHIRQVPIWMKLLGFYLFDAIAKNLFDTHAAVFSTIVVPLFIDTYWQVDAATKTKMEEMLLTWRTAGPDHTEIFGARAQMALQKNIWGDQNTASKQQVLAELHFTLGQMERTVQANPYDQTTQKHISVLHQLRKLVEKGVSNPELQQIMGQLRSLAKSTLPPPIPRPPPPATTPYYNSRPPFAPHHVPPFSVPAVPNPDQLQSAMPSMHYPQPSSSTQSAQAMPDISNLFSSLVNAGLLPAAPTPVPVAGPSVVTDKSLSETTDRDSSVTAAREYRNAILRQPIDLSSTDLTKVQPRVVEFLYERQASKCRQCGLRFSEMKSGDNTMESHLDMHFRQNSKTDQGRGHSRSWYIPLEDWIQDVSSGSAKGKGRADGPAAKAAAAVELAKRDAELRNQFVVVPPGAEAQVVSCPICKEVLKSEFLEDEEEWVWKNAVKKEDKIYHATCHADALEATSNLVARLRTDKAQASRSATPEAHSAGTKRWTSPPPGKGHMRHASGSKLSPEKIAGVKRKVEDGTPTSEETTGTPPLKKVALATTSS